MNNISTSITNSDLPGLYQVADAASLQSQKDYSRGLAMYLLLLIIAALASFLTPFLVDIPIVTFNLILAILFLVTLSIMIWLRVKRPDDIWYNGRVIAESVKTRTWRWMMKAEPYYDYEDTEVATKKFIYDLKIILKQNQTLIGAIGVSVSAKKAITEKMLAIRLLPIKEREKIYRKERIDNQAEWYSKKSVFNKKRAQNWFWLTVVLHAAAIIMILYRIQDPQVKLPIEFIIAVATSVLSWLQTKKYNELSSSYSLAAHEIMLIKEEAIKIDTEKQLSDFVVDCENAFSREHTQWVARRNK